MDYNKLEQTFVLIMSKDTKAKLETSAKQIFARSGYEGLSMRTLSKDSSVNLSTIYHYFDDKDQLLRALFRQTGSELGKKREKLPRKSSAVDTLRDRIRFQFENIEDIVFVLKYYLHFREEFEQNNRGYIPERAYLHIKEVVEKGVDTGEFRILRKHIDKESKVIAHAINGFLLEYYPSPPTGKELSEIVDGLHSFIVRGLSAGRSVMI